MDEEFYRKQFKFLIKIKEKKYYNILKAVLINVFIIKMLIMFYRNLLNIEILMILNKFSNTLKIMLFKCQNIHMVEE